MASRLLLFIFTFAIFFASSDGANAQFENWFKKKSPELLEDGDFYAPLENDIVIVSKSGQKHKFEVELALTRDEQAKGLMFRKELPKSKGMLFLFRTTQVRSFWMKNTLIPLDIIFLEADGRIQHIHSMAEPQDLGMITSGKSSKAVVELAGGVADQLNIKVGDFVHHSAFRNINLLAQ